MPRSCGDCGSAQRVRRYPCQTTPASGRCGCGGAGSDDCGQQTWSGWPRARAQRETRPGQRTEAWLGGEERADRWAPSVSDGKRGCGVTRAGLGERERGGAGPRGLREAGTRAGRLRRERAGWAEREVWAEPVWRGLGRRKEKKRARRERCGPQGRKGEVGLGCWVCYGFGFWVLFFLFFSFLNLIQTKLFEFK